MNGFTSGAAEQLSEAFKSNCTLQYVDLSDNDIDDQGATLLSSGVEGMKSLAEFGLNRITAKEAGERALNCSICAGVGTKLSAVACIAPRTVNMAAR